MNLVVNISLIILAIGCGLSSQPVLGHSSSTVAPSTNIEENDRGSSPHSKVQIPKQTYDELNRIKVFRSVLDDKPRMLTIDFAPNLKAAYDTTNATLYKVWQGDVKLQGSVFNQKHGVQPDSVGAPYFLAANNHWQILEAGRSLDFELRYLGHRFQEDQVDIRYQINLSSGQEIFIVESPRLVNGNPTSTLTRRFKVIGLRQGQQLVSQDLILNEGITAVDVQLNTTIEVNEAPNLHSELTSLSGQQLIDNDDCAACHNPTSKTVGPAYLAIAKRYPDSDEVITTLGQKIIDGGSGVWGPIPMSPHHALTLQDAKAMAKYILSLDDNLSDNGTVKSIPINFSGETPTVSSNSRGLVVNLHKFSGDQPNINNLRTESPILAGIAPGVHINRRYDLTGRQRRFAYHIQGELQIPQDATYTFRLLADDGARLFLDQTEIIENWPSDGSRIKDGTITLTAGKHELELFYYQTEGRASLSLQWFNQDTQAFEVVPEEKFSYSQRHLKSVTPVISDKQLMKAIPGDKIEVADVHPSFDLYQARPDDFEPMVGGIDFKSDGSMVVSTWDPDGSVYLVQNYLQPNPNLIKVTRIAKGLAEPLGLKVIDDQIYVLQKHELTLLLDHDGDQLIDEYHAITNKWLATSNFHEFAFGLEYKAPYLYLALATAIKRGGVAESNQVPDRGKILKVHKDTGEITFIASGLRTPNGLSFDKRGRLFVTDNQGDWLPSSKLIEVTEGHFYGGRSVDFEGTKLLKETQPVVWLPQDEIGNSPSEPAPLNVGPYQDQMIHGEVTHGGLKRVFTEQINGRQQGAVFRFSQGLEAGVNRIEWAPSGDLIVGGIGNPGNWSHKGKSWFGLQRLTYNHKPTFEMLAIRAKSDGFEIEFTHPIKLGQQIRASDFQIKQWHYKPTSDYGGPKLGLTDLTISKLTISTDRKRIFLSIDGLKEQHVVYFRIVRPFAGGDDLALWTTESWYTLNSIPKDLPVSHSPSYQNGVNRLSLAEQEAGWELLFDGQQMGHIRNFNSDKLGNKWVVEDDALHLQGKATLQTGWQTPNGGDIVITKSPVKDFELYLEWKIGQGGNSGIIYGVDESQKLKFPFMTGIEYQLLDNVNHKDGQIEKHRAADLYDLISTRFIATNPVGQWNRTRIVVNNGFVEHWLNGYKLVEFDMNSPQWQKLLANSKFKKWPHAGIYRTGHIVLQDHGDKVWFRNIKIRKISE